MKRALVLLLLVVACGGGGDDARSAKDRYLAAAEAVCADANAELAQARKERPASIAAVSPYVHRLIEIARRNVQSLAALEPPPAAAVELEAKVLTPLRDQLRDGDAYEAKVAAAAAAKDNAALLALVTNPPTKTKVDLAFMRSFGFEQCVKAADTSGASG